MGVRYMFVLKFVKMSLSCLPGRGLAILGLSAALGMALMPLCFAAENELTALHQGKVLVEDEASSTPTQASKKVVAKILIQRPVDKVWSTLRDQRNLYRGDPHIKAVKVLDQPSVAEEMVMYTLHVSSFLPDFTYTTHIRFKPMDFITFRRTEGSFKDFQGYCRLIPSDHGKSTVFTYALQVDPGFFIPQFLMRQILRQELPDMIRNVQKTVYTRFPGNR